MTKETLMMTKQFRNCIIHQSSVFFCVQRKSCIFYILWRTAAAQLISGCIMYLSEAGEGGRGRGKPCPGVGKVMDDSPTGPGTLLPSFSSLSSVLHLTISHIQSPDPPPLLPGNAVCQEYFLLLVSGYK